MPAPADYVDVAQRIVAFYAEHPEGSLTSEIVRYEWEPNGQYGKGLVVMKAYAHRTPTDPLPGVGHAKEIIPGGTNFTRGSELENCETSAWGRAIAALGFEVKKGITTRQDVERAGGGKPATKKKDAAKPRGATVADVREVAKLYGALKKADGEEEARKFLALLLVALGAEVDAENPAALDSEAIAKAVKGLDALNVASLKESLFENVERAEAKS